MGELPALLAPAAQARKIAQQSLAFFNKALYEHHSEEEKELFTAVLGSAHAGDERMQVQALIDQLTADHRALEKLWESLAQGLHKVAKFYYYPGWWEGAATLSLFINPKAMAALPADYAAALRVAAAEANQWSTAKYDVTNPQALRRLVAGGAQLRRFPTPVLNMCSKAATELYAELSDKSPAFKKIYTPWAKFRDEQVMWSQFCEMPFDNYMATRKA